MRETLRDQIRRLTKERDAEREARSKDAAAAQHALGKMAEERDKLVLGERRLRVAAQRGLVPYVRSLEQFDAWLLERPDLRHALRPVLQELGLWEIKLGYDPDHDLSLSVVSPHRV